MNTAKTENNAVARALGRLDAWFESMRVGQGYDGPVVGLRGVAMGYCGPGYDWRYEGILDGAVALAKATKDTRWLDRIERDLGDIAAAQLLDGTFRNSQFEANPCEGGMPHEPAMLAAGCRAARALQEAGRTPPAAFLECAARYIDEYLIKFLWNKLLKTFNDWPISQFQDWTPHACASAIELLAGYADLTGSWERYAYYAQGAANSIVKLQVVEGPFAGAVPPSSRDRVIRPFLAARNLPGLSLAGARLNESKYTNAARRLAEFVLSQFSTPTVLPRMVCSDRPSASYPRVLGAFAGTLLALRRAGAADDTVWPAQCAFLLERQRPSGAFDNAVGFGAVHNPKRVPDWRDIVPVCGWQDKIFALLAETGVAPAEGQRIETTSLAITVQGRRAQYHEDAASMRIEDSKGHALFSWTKGSPWPQACVL